MVGGERLLGAAFGALGVFWIFESLDLGYMGEFAPGSGFLPLWLGISLVVLAAIFLFRTRGQPSNTESEAASGHRFKSRTVPITLGLFACVAAIDWLGFGVAVSVYLIFLIRLVEHYSWRMAIAIGLGTAVGLHLVFQAWLGVPLPEGPWGF